MKISVCCPSYKRPKVKSFDFFGDILKVYVCESEAEAYRKANVGFENNIVAVPLGVQGNVARIRNYILNDRKDDDVCCIVDDDMSYIGYYEKLALHKLEKDEILPFIEKYTLLCQEFGFKMWGVNLNSDPQCYREYTPFSTTSVVLGPFSCFLKGNECRYDENLPLKEDYDISLQNLNKYRGILRVNKYHYSCAQSTNAGGCATYRNIEKEKNQLKMLQKKWGGAIVKSDNADKSHSSKKVRKGTIDYNPIIKTPIKGV